MHWDKDEGDEWCWDKEERGKLYGERLERGWMHVVSDVLQRKTIQSTHIVE